MPVVAGISYELIRLAGKHDNFFVNLLSAPGFLFQKITTKEPDDSMLEVAIRSLKAVTEPDAPHEFDGFVTTDGIYTPLEPKPSEPAA